MRKYELTLIAKPSLKDAESKKLIETIKDLLKDFKVTKEDDLGQKPLAYAIKKEVAGRYVFMQFEGEEALAKDFETKLLRNENIIRHLLIRTK